MAEKRCFMKFFNSQHIFTNSEIQNSTNNLVGIVRCAIAGKSHTAAMIFSFLFYGIRPFIAGENPSAIDSESIKPLSPLHSGLKREW